MDDSVKASTPDRSDTGNWVGRIIVAVILGEAIWNLIVSVMNNLIVPWLGDVMGQSSGLPLYLPSCPITIQICLLPSWGFALRGSWPRFSTISYSAEGPDK